MFALSDKITSFINKIHRNEEWMKNLSITEVLFSHLSYINNEIEKSYSKPPLIIFDIDNTLFDAGKFSKRFPLLEAIEPTLTFYQYVKDLGYHIVLLTGRKKDRREFTIENLNRIKVKTYDDIIFRQNDDLSISKYKLNQRKNLAQKYTIVANIGDQITDFEGGYNGKIIKLPNF